MGGVFAFAHRHCSFISTYFDNDVSAYYVNCDPTSTSPFATQFFAMDSYIDSAYNYALQIDNVDMSVWEIFVEVSLITILMVSIVELL